jgi:hypothetical protein
MGMQGSISTGENKLGKKTIGKNGVAYNNSDVARGRISPVFSI